MKLEIGLEHIKDKVNLIDVEGIFPGDIDQNVCYTEMAKQALLDKIKEIQYDLAQQLFHFLETMGAIDTRELKRSLPRKRVHELVKTLLSDPFQEMKPNIPPEFQKLADNVKEYNQTAYIYLVEILTMLAWKHEILGDNILFLKSKLAETCSQLYLDLKSNELVAKIDEQGKVKSSLFKDRKRSDAIMFSRSSGPTRVTLDVGAYADMGGLVLMEAANLYFNTYYITQTNYDHIQAFRSFRKAVRVRKRFGLTETMRNYLMDKDLLMTQSSIAQMGGKKDLLELRRFEVEMRTQQQIRNLKHKTIIAE